MKFSESLINQLDKIERNSEEDHTRSDIARVIGIIEQAEPVHNLSYQHVFDEALDMARTLQAIDDELVMAAQCEGNHPGGYPADRLLPNLCKIMYKSFGYHKNEQYQKYNKVATST